jgi:hypothetical protein
MTYYFFLAQPRDGSRQTRIRTNLCGTLTRSCQHPRDDAKNGTESLYGGGGGRANGCSERQLSMGLFGNVPLVGRRSQESREATKKARRLVPIPAPRF